MSAAHLLNIVENWLGLPAASGIRQLLFRASLLISLSLAAFGLAYFSPQDSANSDPRLSLLTAQAILEHRSLKLDPYEAQLGPEFKGNYRINAINGEHYYAYPLGPSLLALPVVMVARWAGWQMSDMNRDLALQNGLSALSVAAILLLAYAVARTRLGYWPSLLLATVFTFGSSWISTLATAWWNLNVAVLALLSALWLLLRLEKRVFRWYEPYLLGFALFWAYLSRPSTAIFIGLTLFYCLIWQRQQFLRIAGTAIVCLLGLVFIYYGEFSLPLHPYYLPAALGGVQGFDPDLQTPLPLALFGLLFSPSRGLFSFSPFLLLLPAFSLLRWQRLRRLPWFCLSWLWIAAHLLVIARFNVWWGGYSFGPRLLTDLLPAFFLLAILLWADGAAPGQRNVAHAWPIWGLGGLLAVISLGIHSGSGLFNSYTTDWNGNALAPDVNLRPGYIFDWRYPQFLASQQMLCARNADFNAQLLADGELIVPGFDQWEQITRADARYLNDRATRQWLAPEKPTPPAIVPAFRPAAQLFFPVISRDATGPGPTKIRALLVGWQPAGNDLLAICAESSIILPTVTADFAASPWQLVITGQSAWPTSVHLNGQLLGELPAMAPAASYALPVTNTLLQPDSDNQLTFTWDHEPTSARQPSLRLTTLTFVAP
ncbi:MAG: hypothetical protein KDE09_06815 [Anaerolineales bacterium]|nr:hypothetical protein [Anaerolineales bacterium]